MPPILFPGWMMDQDLLQSSVGFRGHLNKVGGLRAWENEAVVWAGQPLASATGDFSILIKNEETEGPKRLNY